MENNELIKKDEFVFANQIDKKHDKGLETKPLSYFKDALFRFSKNKASIVAFIIISLLILFAIIGPFTTNYNVSYKDENYKYALPKSNLFSKLGVNFWDGCKNVETNKDTFYYNYAIGLETNINAIKNQKYTIIEKKDFFNRDVLFYKYRLDTYRSVGNIFMNVTESEYESIQQYQDEKNCQVIYPITNKLLRPSGSDGKSTDANYWYKTDTVGGKTVIAFNSDGELENIYSTYTGNDNYTSKMRIEGNEKLYDYSLPNQTSYEIRVNYYEYYIYYHSYVLKDGITEPLFIFGANELGKDIYAGLASGARLSFLIAIIVATVNLFVGAIYGAIEGYYGGRIDLFMERFVEILAAVPFMIVITLLKYHMEDNSQLLVLFLAFFLTGWIGMASRTRMQFYRFKNQEYVLAAKTLGASDKRVMFKHIFPNALGTLITSCVLVIPSVIFSETSLSYLGIINLETGNVTSVGTLLANGQKCLLNYPHVILPPAIFICLLMLCFNLFGNGLRDAFNPSLRGVED